MRGGFATPLTPLPPTPRPARLVILPPRVVALTPRWELDGAQRARLVPPLDAYSNRLVMPLAEFARHPIAKDLLHNGEAFQVRLF